MNISLVLSSLQLSGGVLLVIECANRLAARGHRLALVTPAGSAPDALPGRLLPGVAVVESRRALPVEPSRCSLAALAWSLASAVPTADVVVATHTPTVVPVWLAARRRRLPCAWLYMDYPEMFSERPLERWLLAHAPAHFDRIMAISQPLAEAAQPQTRAPIAVVGAGLPRDRLFFDQPRLPSQDDLRRVLYVGDPRPRKGLADFVAAAALVAGHLPHVRFVVVSKLPCDLPAALPLELHLQPSDETLSALYRSADLFVSASWGEGLGYPPLEAMACGTPVVLTDSTGVRDYARSEENCLMTPPQQPSALAAAMLRVLTDPVLAGRLAAGGRVTAQGYDWGAMADRVEAVLEVLCGGAAKERLRIGGL